MDLRKLLPDAQGLRCISVTSARQTVELTVESSRATSCCPVCGTRSSGIHSRYWRTLQDLPATGMKVTLRWRTRRFFCVKRSCTRRIFAEQIEKVADPRTRRTSRLNSVIRTLGFTCGGRRSAQLATRLGISVSRETVLREMRRTPPSLVASPRVVGIDDFAFRKGHRYGTIVCDLERRIPIDLLPDRNAETVATWLRQHPTVQIISRDRGEPYIKGATEGAPDAVQVADRWHLVSNLRQAIERVVYKSADAVSAAVAANEPKGGEMLSNGTTHQADPAKPSTREEKKKEANRRKRIEQYERIMELHNKGVSRREIARRLKIHRSTVGRYVAANGLPERAARNYQSKTDDFLDYLWQRWSEGCQNAKKLTSELNELGYTGSYGAVRRRTAAWRCKKPSKHQRRQKNPNLRVSAQRVSWLFVTSTEKTTPNEQSLMQRLTESCTQIRIAWELADDFLKMIRTKTADLLGDWLDSASSSEAPMEIKRFAQGIGRDRQAVIAGIQSEWSNGQTEGQVNRLKLIKRQMYGRGKFDLLRQRVLSRAA